MPKIKISELFTDRQKKLAVLILVVYAVAMSVGVMVLRNSRLKPTTSDAYFEINIFMRDLCRYARQQREAVNSTYATSGVNVFETFSGGTATPELDYIVNFCDEAGILN